MSVLDDTEKNYLTLIGKAVDLGMDDTAVELATGLSEYRKTRAASAGGELVSLLRAAVGNFNAGGSGDGLAGRVTDLLDEYEQDGLRNYSRPEDEKADADRMRPILAADSWVMMRAVERAGFPPRTIQALRDESLLHIGKHIDDWSRLADNLQARGVLRYSGTGWLLTDLGRELLK